MEKRSLYPFLAYLPYISTFLICLGVVKQMFYYNIFGVRILGYLNVSEVVLMAADDFTWWCLPFGAMMFFAKPAITEENLSKASGVIAFSVLCLALVCFTHPTPRYAIYTAIYYAACGLFLFFNPPIKKAVENYFRRKISYETINIMFILFFSSIVTGLIVTFSAYRKASGCLIPAPVYVKMKDKDLLTNKELIFIGKTEEFVFIYNRCNRSTTIYPMADILEITHFHD